MEEHVEMSQLATTVIAFLVFMESDAKVITFSILTRIVCRREDHFLHVFSPLTRNGAGNEICNCGRTERS